MRCSCHDKCEKGAPMNAGCHVKATCHDATLNRVGVMCQLSGQGRHEMQHVTKLSEVPACLNRVGVWCQLS